jgi:hypothetical protein
MAVLLGAFLLWLFATGEYAAWAALVNGAPPNTGSASGGW